MRTEKTRWRSFAPIPTPPTIGSGFRSIQRLAFTTRCRSMRGTRTRSSCMVFAWRQILPRAKLRDDGVGQISAQLILQRGLYIRNTYNFKLSFEYCLLEPMDLVTVTDSGLGLTNVAIRITAIEEDDAGLLSVTAEEFPGGTATAVQYPVQPKSPNSTNQAVMPARVNAANHLRAAGRAHRRRGAGVGGGVGRRCDGLYARGDMRRTAFTAATQVMLAAVRRRRHDILLGLCASCRAQQNSLGRRYRDGDHRLRIRSHGGGSQNPDAGITPRHRSPKRAAAGSSVRFPISWRRLPHRLSSSAGGKFRTTSYSGTGDGVYLWGAEFAWTNSTSGVSPIPDVYSGALDLCQVALTP